MKSIGIDLGTTNSVAAYCEPGGRGPRILPTSVGENLTPSVVGLKKSRHDPAKPEILVGRPALNYAATAPEDTIFSVKRLMGRDFGDPAIAQVREQFNYRIVSGPNSDPRAYVRLGDTIKSPEEISSLILKQIVVDAGKALGDAVTHAVITVPAYFNEGQRAATRNAGVEAGLIVKKIIDEPTAAAIAFGLQAQSNDRHRCLVYDLGGGTFDISILQIVTDKDNNLQFHVLKPQGDNWLGGDDFDRKIVEKIIDHVQTEYQVDPSRDKRFLVLAKLKAEEAKRALSSSLSTDIVIPAAYKAENNTLVDVDLHLERAEFESMIQEYVDRSMTLVHRALADQQLSPELITDVLLVGGSTLTPLVQQSVEAVFGATKIRRNVNPMECVAIGASYLAASLRGVECPKCKALNSEDAAECKACKGSLAAARAVGDTGVHETTAMDLGIAAVKGDRKDVFVPIIPKGTSYPLRDPMKQRFQAPGGRKIVVPVYEGDDPVASRNAEQGVIDFELPEGIDVNTPVEVAFNYDRDRQVTVTVSIPTTGETKTVRLKRDGPRTRSLVVEREESLETWQDDLDRTISVLTRFVQDYDRYMEVVERNKIERDLKTAKEVLAYPDEGRGKRTARLLQMDLFSCGLATQLFLADQATEGQPENVKREIQQTAAFVRKAHERGDTAVAAEQARVLKVMVAKALETRAGEKPILDQDGILILPDVFPR